MFEFFANNLIWSEGRFILAVLVVVTLVALLTRPVFIIVPLLFFIFSLWFFRNPERVCPEAAGDSSVIVCPADGKILAINQHVSDGVPQTKIAIFMSPLNVHVNRIPVDGVVEEVCYSKGKFLPAYRPKSSELNEHNDLFISCSSGQKLQLRQIAGSIARRIVCWVSKGDQVKAGQSFGMIKFSSRVDLTLSGELALAVRVGDCVRGGETVIGRWTCQ